MGSLLLQKVPGWHHASQVPGPRSSAPWLCESDWSLPPWAPCLAGKKEKVTRSYSRLRLLPRGEARALHTVKCGAVMRQSGLQGAVEPDLRRAVAPFPLLSRLLPQGPVTSFPPLPPFFPVLPWSEGTRENTAVRVTQRGVAHGAISGSVTGNREISGIRSLRT